MSSVEILAKLLKGVKTLGVKNVTVICLGPRDCTVLYNPAVELVWSSDGYLESVIISGLDEEGRTRRFRRTLSWSNGLLVSVSGWEEL